MPTEMTSAPPDLDRLRPAGGKRSGKRDFIVNVFLRQEGHLSADDLVDLIRREDHRISRATVYRTLQWMVDAGIAAQGGLRRGPVPVRALVPAPAALPPDLQDLQPARPSSSAPTSRRSIEESRRRAQLHRAPERAVQIYGDVRGLPCRHGRAAPVNGATTELRVRARRAAHRHRHRAQRPGVLHARRSDHARRARPLRCSRSCAEEEKEHLGTLEARYAELLAARSAARVAADVPLLQGRRQRPVLRGRRAAEPRRQRPAGAI